MFRHPARQYRCKQKAKRVAMSYLLFNIIGAIFFVVVIYGLQLFITFPFIDKIINRGVIANLHFMFNFIIAILLLPFANKIADLTGKIIGDDKESKLTKSLHLSIQCFLIHQTLLLPRRRR